jgi:hypothetical protein
MQTRCMSRRDVFTVHLTARDKAADPASRSEEASARTPFMCPVTDLPCTRYPFAALATCGHVFSCRAIAQVSLGRHCVCWCVHSKKILVIYRAQNHHPFHGVSCIVSLESITWPAVGGERSCSFSWCNSWPP